MHDKKFINPEKVLFASGLSKGQTLADLGAGSGFYTFAAAKIVGEQGLVYAIDILESALDHIAAEARIHGLRNIRTVRADLEHKKPLNPIPTGSADIVLLGNTLHQVKDKKSFMAHAYRLLKTGGKLIVIEWNSNLSPIGPQSHERLSQKEATKLVLAASLRPAGEFETDAYHYGLTFIK